MIFYVVKVIRHCFGFWIKFLENKDIGIFGYLMEIDFFSRYSFHRYFNLFQLPDIVDFELGVLSTKRVTLI